MKLRQECLEKSFLCHHHSFTDISLTSIFYITFWNFKIMDIPNELNLMNLVTKDLKNLDILKNTWWVKSWQAWIFCLEEGSLMSFLFSLFTVDHLGGRYYFEAFQSFRKILFSIVIGNIYFNAQQNKRKMLPVSFSLL